MEIMKSFITFSTLMLYSLITYSSTIIEDTIIYKKTNNKNMFLYITYPKTEKNNLPCIVFFNGGGWVSRKMEQFDSYCKYFANKGFICIRAEYRVSKIDNFITTKLKRAWDIILGIIEKIGRGISALIRKIKSY